MEEKINCKICGKKCNGYVGLRSHISKLHKIPTKQYYDIYLKKDNEDICKCLRKTKFKNISEGYRKYCSLKCTSVFTRVQTKETCLKKYGDANFNNRKGAKETCLKKYGDANFNNRKKCKNTMLKKYGVKHYTNRKKAKDTMLKKYGKYYVNYEKAKQTNLQKYGVKHYARSKEYIRSLIEHGYCTPLEFVERYDIYNRKVWSYTRSCKKELFNKWSGYDYYDNEYIKENMSLHYNNKNYPTIDHKKSIYYGFVNDIDPKIIGSINNLGITKRSLNSSKRMRTEEEFKKDLYCLLV